MRLLPDDGEREFASMLRHLFSVGPESPGLWRSLADAGVLGLALPERYGGSGGALTDLGAFCVEAGRALCPTIVHGTIHAGLVVHALGSADQHAALLPIFTSGTTSATTALWSAVDAGIVTPALRAQPDGDAWTLSGAVDFVLDAPLADYVVVSARDMLTGRTLVFVVPNDADGLRADRLTMMGGQAAGRLRFDGVLVEDRTMVLGGDGGVTDGQLHRIANTATALLSLDLVGVGEAALQRTVDHTVMRQQFGRPIASFQAAQHLVANMHIALAAARLAGRAAVSLLEEGDIATREAAVARMHAAAAAKLVTLDAHQLHGGMGYVVDTDLHRYSERARVLSTLGGGADVAATWLQGADA
ncbi:acyl-CoA dehydrogenase family protein [Mycolicibacterium baixiangningiae]|uniref:acyl-CoA dehydrogenase family protein n=1 Tax=Mycolicibacterium baixiangningiae TaxID=2761578 RepID=UPI0018D0291E|nr:acyl-CoA dehydrogenase family protein [Mycolicibacterium baixiangningiae]